MDEIHFPQGMSKQYQYYNEYYDAIQLLYNTMTFGGPMHVFTCIDAHDNRQTFVFFVQRRDDGREYLLINGDLIYPRHNESVFDAAHAYVKLHVDIRPCAQ